MSGFIGKCVSMMALTTVVLSASSAFAGDCDTYAKLTLQQVKLNVAKGCNFKGARWSLDVSKHRAWCKDVGPAGWRAELKTRNEMLSKKCG